MARKRALLGMGLLGLIALVILGGVVDQGGQAKAAPREVRSAGSADVLAAGSADVLAAGGSRGECPNPPGTIVQGGTTWVKVVEYIQWSGCATNDWRCWTDWMNTGPALLMEDRDNRCNIWRLDQPDSDCWSPWPPVLPDKVLDPRDVCDADGDGVDEAVRGWWFHNAYAYPTWSHYWEDGSLVWWCDWRVNTSYTWYNFGEDDVCYGEECLPSTTPTVTECLPTDPTPIPPETKDVPDPTVPVFNPPVIYAQAKVNSSAMAPATWYKTVASANPSFYWLLNHYLNIKLGGHVAEEGWASGCSVSTADPMDLSLSTYVGGVCATPPAGNSSCAGAMPGCCQTLDSGRPLHLLWTLDADPVAPLPNSIHLWNVKPGWVTIPYRLTVFTTYDCPGMDPQTLPWEFDLSIRVGLMRPTTRR